MEKNNRVLVANITWNDSGWRNLYINQKAGHEYAKKYPGHESLNFQFDKKGIDDESNVYGFIQWTVPPKKLANNAIVIFYTKNLETNDGEIVGIYGDVNILKKTRKFYWEGFKNDQLLSRIVAKKNLSLLFPIPLKSSNYSGGKRLVPQVGYTYKDIDFAEKIISDEIVELQKAGLRLTEYQKLQNIYKFITGNNYEFHLENYSDTEEQEELLPIIKDKYNRAQIILDLKNLTPKDAEIIQYKGKQYKRDNKSIAELKIIRNFKCQMCGLTIIKKDNSKYIEAAHITAKKFKGPETYDNILILCPNHHKEFDMGDRKIIQRNNESIIFDLNNKRYNLDLSLR